MFSSALKSFTSNISSNYTLSPQPTSYSGPWKIFDAKKKSTGKAASVFVFDKKSLEPQGGSFGGRSGASSLKRVHEEVLERLKKEAGSLAKLRHPSILELVEPVEETRNGGLMFATELITASLAGLLQHKDEQEGRGGGTGRGSRYIAEDSTNNGQGPKELEIDELEIQKGLIQIAKGLEFLHESAGLVHGNLTPEAIFVNSKSDWKMSGLAFCSPPENSSKPTSIIPISLAEAINYDPRLPRSVQLNLDYSSPDFIMDNNLNTGADMFSLGILIIALYRTPHRSPVETNGSASTYKRLFNSSSTVPSQNNGYLCSQSLPKEVASGLLPRLITRRPAQRLSAREFQQAPFFDNVLVSTIRFLESLPAKTPNEKAQFMRGLPKVLPQFPKPVLEKKVLPALLEEMKDRELLSLVIQNVFKVISSLPSGREPFTEKVLPRLREIFIPASKSATHERDSSKEAGLMVILENMRIVAENSPGKEFKDDILPILIHALESPTHSLVDAALKTLSVILPVLDFSTIKNDLFPVIANVFSKTSSMGIKVKGLEALRTLCGGSSTSDIETGFGNAQPSKSNSSSSSSILDRYTIQEKVVPLLKAIRTKEPAVMMASLDVFREVGKAAETDFLALEILPILWQFSLGSLLNLNQFQSFMTLIKTLSSKVEQEQTRKLKDLTSNNLSPTSGSNNQAVRSNGFDTSPSGEEPDFESLVLGRKISAAPGSDSFESWGDNKQTLAARQGSNASATFAWSTTSPVSPKNMVGSSTISSTLQPMVPISRTITPDHTMGSFAPLQPASNASAFSQPMQPFRPSGSISNPPLAPSRNPSTASMPQQTAIDWSAASVAVHAANMPVQSRVIRSQSSNATSLASLATMQPLQPTQTSSYSMSGPSGHNNPTTNSPFAGFSIAPPPAMGTPQSQMSGQPYRAQPPQQQQQQQQQQQYGQKQGMDKYESLL